MANLVINGATYDDVPSIEVPNEQGEMSRFMSREIVDAIIARTLTGSHEFDFEYIRDYAFASCPIDEITLPNIQNDVGYYSIGNYAFYQCSKLKKVTSNCTKIGYGAFYSAIALETCNFPNLKYIDYFGYYNSSKLEQLDCHNLISCGAYSFQKSGIKALIIRADSVPALLSSNAFENCPIASGTGYIYVPSALVDSYKSATNWSVYTNQFRALEDYTVDGTITGELDESKI